MITTKGTNQMIQVIHHDSSISYLSIISTEEGEMLRVEKDLDGYAEEGSIEDRVQYWATSEAMISRWKTLTGDGIPLHVTQDWVDQNLFLQD